MPLRTITPSSNPLSMYPQINQILEQTPTSVTYPHVIKDLEVLKTWVLLSEDKAIWIFGISGYALSIKVWSQWVTRQTTWKRIWTIFKHKNKCHKQLKLKRNVKKWSLVSILPSIVMFLKMPKIGFFCNFVLNYISSWISLKKVLGGPSYFS